MVLNKVGEHEVTSDFSGDVDVSVGGDVSSSDTVTLSASNTQNISSDTTINLADNKSINKTVSASVITDEQIAHAGVNASSQKRIGDWTETITKATFNTSNTNTYATLDFLSDSYNSIASFGWYSYGNSYTAPLTIDLPPMNFQGLNNMAGGYIMQIDSATDNIDFYEEVKTADATIS